MPTVQKRRKLGQPVTPDDAFSRQTPGSSYLGAQRRAKTQPDPAAMPGVSGDMRFQTPTTFPGNLFGFLPEGNGIPDASSGAPTVSELAIRGAEFNRQRRGMGQVPPPTSTTDQRMRLGQIPVQQMPMVSNALMSVGDPISIERGPYTGGAQIQQVGLPTPLTPRMDSVRRLGEQNIGSINSDPRAMRSLIADEAGNIQRLDAPAANRYRQMQAADPAGPYAGLSSAYSPQRLANTGNAMGLARTPDVPGEGVTDAIAYRPGAAGSSPFVSDGPLSGGPRGQEIQGRLDRERRRLGLDSNVPGYQRRVGQLGVVAEATDDGGIRHLGPIAQQTMARTGQTGAQLSAQRDNIIGGTNTTFVDNGDGVRDRQDIRALHPEQQANMDLRGQRMADLRDFRDERRTEGLRRLGRLPSEQDQLAIDENREFQRRQRELGLQQMESQVGLDRDRLTFEQQQARDKQALDMRRIDIEERLAIAQQQLANSQTEMQARKAEADIKNLESEAQVNEARALGMRAEAGLPLGGDAPPQSLVSQLYGNAAARGLSDQDVGQALMSANNMDTTQALARVRELSKIPAAMRTDEQQSELDALEAATKQPWFFRMTDPWNLRNRFR